MGVDRNKTRFDLLRALKFITRLYSLVFVIHNLHVPQYYFHNYKVLF